MTPELEAELTALLRSRRDEEPRLRTAIQGVVDWQNGHDERHTQEERARQSLHFRLTSLEAVSSRRMARALAAMALLLAAVAGFELGTANARSGARAPFGVVP